MNQLPVELGQAMKQAFAVNSQLAAFTSLAAHTGQCPVARAYYLALAVGWLTFTIYHRCDLGLPWCAQG